MKKLILTFTFALIIGTTFAQNYTTAIGMRFEALEHGNGGFSIKHFTNQQTAFEGLVMLGDRLIEFHGLYEYHQAFRSNTDFNWFVGGGAHLGFESSDVIVGIDGIIGVDYTFPRSPINLSIDWHPVYNLVSPNTSTMFWPQKMGISIRYAF